LLSNNYVIYFLFDEIISKIFENMALYMSFLYARPKSGKPDFVMKIVKMSLNVCKKSYSSF